MGVSSLFLWWGIKAMKVEERASAICGKLRIIGWTPPTVTQPNYLKLTEKHIADQIREAQAEQRERDAAVAGGYEKWAMEQLDLASRHERIETAKDIEKAIRDDS